MGVMMRDIEIIIPWLGGFPHRERALAWLQERCQPSTIAPGSEPWIKALAIIPAVERSQAEIVVVHDADCWSDGLLEAIQAVQDGAAWAIPHWMVHRLDRAGTDAVINGADWREQELERPPYAGMAGGGILVARRETILDIPMDPRFIGWGHEDESWAMALWCLLGPPWRGEAPMVHLWHEGQPRITRRLGSQPSWNLRNRYANARFRPDAMRILLQEAKDDFRSLDAASNNSEAVGFG